MLAGFSVREKLLWTGFLCVALVTVSKYLRCAALSGRLSDVSAATGIGSLVSVLGIVVLIPGRRVSQVAAICGMVWLS
jgi:hypothetical protein